jgi:hypothetical protein
MTILTIIGGLVVLLFVLPLFIQLVYVVWAVVAETLSHFWWIPRLAVIGFFGWLIFGNFSPDPTGITTPIISQGVRDWILGMAAFAIGIPVVYVLISIFRKSNSRNDRK